MSTVAPGDLAQPTISATLLRMGQELDNRQKELAGYQDKIKDQQQQLLALQGEYGTLVEKHDTARASACAGTGRPSVQKCTECGTRPLDRLP